MVREGCAETAAALAADKRAIVRMGSVERGKEERKQGGGDGEEGRGREKQGRGGKGEGGEGKRCARALREKFPGYPATLKSANLTLTGEIFASVGSKSTRRIPVAAGAFPSSGIQEKSRISLHFGWLTTLLTSM